MKAIYVTPNYAFGDGLRTQLAEMSPRVDLEVRPRATEARALLTAGHIDVLLTDTLLPADDASDLLADVRQHKVPLVVIVALETGIGGASFRALQAVADDHVWSYSAGTNHEVNARRFALDVSSAIHRVVERRHPHNPPTGDPSRFVYVGDDDQVRELLTGAVGVTLVGTDSQGADAAVIDESPYDAIREVQLLREWAPRIPIVLLCRSEIHDPEGVASMLGIERVIVKSGDWRAQVLPALQTLAGEGRPAVPLQADEAAVRTHVSHISAAIEPSMEVSTGIGGYGSSLRSNVSLPIDDPYGFDREAGLVGVPNEEALVSAGPNWSANAEALTRTQEELAAEQSRREELQQQLLDARAQESRLLSTLDTERLESQARLQAEAHQHEQALARERSEHEEILRRLNEAQEELRQRSARQESAFTESRTGRRKSRLADLSVSVVTELDSLLTDVTATATLAAETLPTPSPLKLQLDRLRRTAGRGRDIARHFLLFSRWQIQPPQPTDLNALAVDLEPTLQRVVGSSNEILLRIEPAVVLLSPSQEHVGRILLALAILCRDALPIGGQVSIEVRTADVVPVWDPSLSEAEPLSFVVMTATASGYAPTPVHTTPSLDSLVREHDGHCDEVSTDEPSTGLRVYLPRGGSVSR